MEYLIAKKVPDFSAKACVVAVFMDRFATQKCNWSRTKMNQFSFFKSSFFSVLLLFVNMYLFRSIRLFKSYYHDPSWGSVVLRLLQYPRTSLQCTFGSYLGLSGISYLGLFFCYIECFLSNRHMGGRVMRRCWIIFQCRGVLLI